MTQQSMENIPALMVNHDFIKEQKEIKDKIRIYRNTRHNMTGSVTRKHYLITSMPQQESLYVAPKIAHYINYCY